MKRGVAGIVTDGGFRDAAEIAALDMPSFHVRPSAPTNLTRHQAVDINVPIGCGDAPVWPGDVIVGDADGWSSSLRISPTRSPTRVSR